MSNNENRTEGKSQNPLHSSFILTRPNYSFEKQQNTTVKLSHFYTKATSEFQQSNDRNHPQIVNQYLTRIKNLQAGYERSRQQYQSSIKNMYKQKIVLLNIISHNQSLVNEFRSKLKIQTSSFKQIETKYNIITSGLFHHQLCSTCIRNITNADFQCKDYEKEKEVNKKVEKNQKKRKKMLRYAKQYSWMYVPNMENSGANKLKVEIAKLKNAIQEMNQAHNRKINDKNHQIEHLKSEITRISKEIATPIHKIVILANNQQQKPQQKFTVERNLLQKSRQKVRQLQEELMFTKDIYEALFKQTNQKIIMNQLEKLNAKYRSRFY